MNKPLKVLSTASLAAAMAVTSLTPVMAAEQNDNEATYKFIGIVFLDGEKLASLTPLEYAIATKQGKLNDTITHLTFGDNTTYSVMDYAVAFVRNGKDVKKTKDALAEKTSYNDISKGYIDENGKVRVKADEQPEDRLNETFFYNVA